MELPDFVPSPNQRNVDVYETENQATDRKGAILTAMSDIAPWASKTIVDLGCGTGFWLTKYCAAARVIGVEPDEKFLSVARQRKPDIEVLHGSAEHIPLPDNSVDIVHARFAYFFPPGCEPGYDEAMRVLRPNGRLVVVDNDLRNGEFADLVTQSSWADGQGAADVTDNWWDSRGATRTQVMSDWTFDSRADIEAVLRMELPAKIADPWLIANPARLQISYGYVLFASAPA